MNKAEKRLYDAETRIAGLSVDIIELRQLARDANNEWAKYFNQVEGIETIGITGGFHIPVYSTHRDYPEKQDK